MHLFGRAKPAAPPPPDPAKPSGSTNPNDSIIKLKDAVDTVEKREEHLTRKIDKEIADAKKFSAAGKKREALQCLKRKKLYEAQVESLSGQKNNLTAQMLALEQMNVTKEVLAAQRDAAQNMQAMTAGFGGTEGVERIYESIEDGMADANEIQETLSRQLDVPGVDGLDDDDLLAELEGMEQDELTAELGKVDLSDSGPQAAKVPTNQPLPAVPTKAVTQEEEDELAELERSMAM